MIDFGEILGKPDYTYGWSKLTGEYLGRIAVEKYKLKVAVVRPFSGYGEDQEPVYPFPAIALRVAARRNPVIVWGNGLQSRDFVHIDDAVEACVRACRRPGRMREILDWRPAISLDEGIRRGLGFARQRLAVGVQPEE
jgi:nucleoside-diphosphate-sugar epimerase